MRSPKLLPTREVATVLFLRLSKDREESESIDVQRANALAFVRRMGWQDEEVIESCRRGRDGGRDSQSVPAYNAC